MPEESTIKKARRDRRQGKSASTQAGEFVREEIHHVREGKHGAQSTEQAIAIGLSKARRSGVKLPRRGAAKKRAASKKRTTAARRTGRSPRSTASPRALSAHAKAAARKRSHADRVRAAKKAARTRKRRGH